MSRKTSKSEMRKPWELLCVACVFFSGGLGMLLNQSSAIIASGTTYRGEVTQSLQVSADILRPFGYLGIALGAATVATFFWIVREEKKSVRGQSKRR